MQAIVSESYRRAKELIQDNERGLERIAEALLEREVLDGEEVMALIRGETLLPLAIPPPPDEDAGGPEAPQPVAPSTLPGLDEGQPSPA